MRQLVLNNLLSLLIILFLFPLLPSDTKNSIITLMKHLKQTFFKFLILATDWSMIGLRLVSLLSTVFCCKKLFVLIRKKMFEIQK